MGVQADRALWVFGYGSLIWRVDFPYVESRPAHVLGWARRFWQGSTDHRGVPGSPGRVVTLVRAPGERCRGRAYRIAGQDRASVLDHLDHREKGGYERLELPIHFDDGSVVDGTTYHAAKENPEFLGAASVEDIAAQVRRSAGPSGPNVEYVLRLRDALAELGADDPHVSALAGRVQS
jgi:cation transport regulator ChaC